ncbi:MAG: hypothetical protein JSU86_12270 [Phycisphaerales bacterium]|nr:MAG: hypothetical protein JSU86_12270 [Phycisphaerales bacterium]
MATDGAVFDGRYVYFAPRHNAYRLHGEVLRYNVASDTPTVSEWGTVGMVPLVLAAGTVMLVRRRAATT